MDDTRVETRDSSATSSNEVGHVTRLEYQGKEILLVGTAHVSQKSVEEVRRVISAERPDTVCVELDEGRLAMLVDDAAWQNLDIFQVVRQKRVLFLLSSLALSAYQRKMGERLGVRPGAELLEAVRACKDVDAELVLADRDIQATLKRTWANLSFFDKAKVATGLFFTPFAVEEIDEERIEELKDRDAIGEMLREVAKEMPRVKTPLIDERDHFLMAKIQEAPGKKIVGVVGAAHVTGMVEYLGKPADYERLCRIPPPSKLWQLVKYLFPLLVLGAFAWGYHQQGSDGLEAMLYAWILPNMIGAGILAIVALAHPLTVLVSIIASPITSLVPVVGAGMVAGLLEAYLKKPKVSDFQTIQDATSSLGALYKNRVTHVLLVTVLVNLGSSLGAYAAGALLARLL